MSLNSTLQYSITWIHNNNLYPNITILDCSNYFAAIKDTAMSNLAESTFLFKIFFFPDGVSLCSFGCPGAHYVHQAGFEHTKDLPSSAFQVLRLKACHTMSVFKKILKLH